MDVEKEEWCSLIQPNCFTCDVWSKCMERFALKSEREALIDYLMNNSTLVVADGVSYFLTKKESIKFLVKEIGGSICMIFKTIFKKNVPWTL